MANNQFLNELARITKIPQDEKNTTELAQILLKGAEEDLNVYALCAQDKRYPDRANQLYAGFPNMRVLLCYTSEAEAKKNKKPLPPNSGREIICIKYSIRDMICNALSKDSIVALGLDVYDTHGYIIPKDLIAMLSLVK